MLSVLKHYFESTYINKKVLLRERKRHTARRVVSTLYVVLTGYPPPAGYPPVLTWPGGTLPGYPSDRVPPTRVPLQLDLAGYPPPGWTWQGTPPGWTWQGTPLAVCPMAFWEILQSIMGYG